MNGRQQILALSGGGYRGLFAVRVLEDLERMSGRPLRERFDLVAGTSIGALLAAGVACGVSATTMANAFRVRGGTVFDRKMVIAGVRLPFERPATGLLATRYRFRGLEEVVREILGAAADRTILDVAMPFMAVATNRQRRRPAIFRSWDRSTSEFAKASLLDAVIASAAAPTYFPERTVCGSSLNDGGLIANAPDLLAITEHMARTNAPVGEIDVLSVGTAGVTPRDPPGKARAHGALRAFLPNRFGGGDLFSTTIACQEAATLNACATLLGSRHLRLDAAPTEAERLRLGLDRTDVKASELLEDLGSRAISDLSRDSRTVLEAMMRHGPLPRP